jgi:outer membrane protein assembly factor BamC
VNATTRLGLLALPCCPVRLLVLEGDKIDYKSATKGSTLEVPPDLTQLSPKIRATPCPAAPSLPAPAGRPGKRHNKSCRQPGRATSIGDVRIERDGNQRWLVVNRPADKLWEPGARVLAGERFHLHPGPGQPGHPGNRLGRKPRQAAAGCHPRTLGKVFDSLYSTGERDKFRTRLERNANGGTEIFISHRGMIEVYTNTQKDSTVWQPRAADPELETEFLRRLMVKLGVSQEQSKAVGRHRPTQAPAARIATVNNAPVVQLDEEL